MARTEKEIQSELAHYQRELENIDERAKEPAWDGDEGLEQIRADIQREIGKLVMELRESRQ